MDRNSTVFPDFADVDDMKNSTLFQQPDFDKILRQPLHFGHFSTQSTHLLLYTTIIYIIYVRTYGEFFSDFSGTEYKRSEDK